jgi:excisionase family DNA binding protein
MSPAKAPTLLLTVEEAAAELRLSRTAVYARITSGEIPSIKIGTRRRVRRADLETYVKSLAATGPA